MSTSPSSKKDRFWIVKADGEGHGVEVREDTPRGRTAAEMEADWMRMYRRFAFGESHQGKARFTQIGKSRWYDFLWCEPPFNHLVSDRFISVLEDTEATGWTTYPVALRDRKGAGIRGYRGLCVLGRAGPQLVSRAKRVKRGHRTDPARQHWALRGFYLAEESWDGSDVFMAEGRYDIFMTDRVVRAMKRAGLKGIVYCPQSEFELDEELVLKTIRGRTGPGA